jgi:hypothetical protein
LRGAILGVDSVLDVDFNKTGTAVPTDNSPLNLTISTASGVPSYNTWI